ncbi:MAG: signal peptide peptidase SppA [Alistipes sp.]|nr:signal peptide peptidase SppA [Alistipes sp.]
MNFWKTFVAALAAVVVGFGVVFIFSIIFGVSLLGAFGGESTATPKDSVLYIDLSESITDSPSSTPEIDINSLSMDSSITILQTLSAIEAAATDANIKGICIYQNGTGLISVTNIEELRQALIRFKQSGKFVVAYDDAFTQSEYYLASVADRISMNPEGDFEWKGISFSTMFMKGMLDKLDISVEIFRPTVCKYKSAVEPYFLTKMSEANRQQMESLAKSMWTTICEDVAQMRNIKPETLEMLAAGLSVNNPDEAKKFGFIDAIEYEDDLYSYLIDSGVKVDRKGEIHKISLGEYANNLTLLNTQLNDDRSIGIIYAEGQIVDGKESSNGYIFGNTLAKQIREARHDDNIKSVVVRVNSPGGSALASEIIWREMTLLQKSKPVVISMSEYAASGGYYISAPADYIIADKLTLTGSIGVFGMIPNLSNLLSNKLGITLDYAATSPEAAYLAPLSPMTQRQKEVNLQKVDAVYETFTSLVADGRNLTIDKVYSIAEGRIWSGSQAVDNGLADANGGLHEAILKAAELADLGADFKLKEITMPLTPFEAWLSSMGMMMAKSCGIDYNVYGEDIQSIIEDNISLFTHSGILMAMPQYIEVNL